MPIEGKANLNKDHSFTDFPITISNNVKSSVSNWSMKGNGQQTGTPTPDDPIQPEFVGTLSGADWTIPITCAGQTTPVYLGQTQTVRRVRKLVLTGEENGYGKGNQNPTDASYYFRASTFGIPNAIQTPHTICTHVQWGPYTDGTIYISQTGMTFYLNLGINVMNAQSSGNTVAGLREYLTQQYTVGTPVTIWYVLAESETEIVNEPLCKIGDYADELLSTSEGTPQLTLSTEEPNIISFETNLQPSKFNIKYYEEDYTKIKDIQMQIPTAKTYNYTEYPITISNAVSSNCSIDLFGNSIQNGTPSPDNHIMPEFVGNLVGNDWTIPITYSAQTSTVYVGQTSTVRRIKKLVLTGEESITSTHLDVGLFNIGLTGYLKTNNSITTVCSHYTTITNQNAWSGVTDKSVCVYGNPGNLTQLLYIRDSDYSTVDAFKQFLSDEYSAGHPVVVWYVLASPTEGIVNEPLAKIGDYSDELQTTIQLEPFNQNLISIDTQLQPSKVSLTYKTKESTDPYKSIKYVLDNNNNYLYKSPYFYTWEGIREIVRAGKASEYYPIGSIIYDNFDESTGTAFQVVAYDDHFDPTLTAQGYTHSMTLCELLLTDVITFDAQEAFLYTEVDIPAGTYKFTIPNYDATYGGNKSYYFTSTATLPSGSQIVMSWPYQQTPKTVTGYAGPNPQTNTTALSGFSALTLTEWVDGTSPEATDLGTIAGPTTQLGTSNYGQMNHIHRARYGSNNYLQSGIRQYINSNSAANAWWTPQTVFDRPYGSRTSAGRLTKLNQDLVSVMATPEIESRTNSYFEKTSLDGTTFTLSTDYTINTDKMFLLSPMEVNFNTTDTTIGTTLDYYVGADNTKRIKLRKSNNTAYYWWLRTPYPSSANYVRGVNTSGALISIHAYNSSGAAPACVIQ